MKIIFYITLVLFVLSIVTKILTKNNKEDKDNSNLAAIDLEIAFIFWVLEYNNIANPFNISYVAIYLIYIIVTLVFVVGFSVLVNLKKRRF